MEWDFLTPSWRRTRGTARDVDSRNQTGPAEARGTVGPWPSGAIAIQELPGSTLAVDAPSGVWGAEMRGLRERVTHHQVDSRGRRMRLGGTRRGACNLKPSNQRLNYNHELFRTAGHGGAIVALSSWPANGAVAGHRSRAGIAYWRTRPVPRRRAQSALPARSEPLDSHAHSVWEDHVAYSPKSIVQTLILPGDVQTERAQTKVPAVVLREVQDHRTEPVRRISCGRQVGHPTTAGPDSKDKPSAHPAAHAI